MPASAHIPEAKEFISWILGDEYQSVMANALPGLYGMSDTAKVELTNPVRRRSRTCAPPRKARRASARTSSPDPNPGFSALYEETLA